MMVKVTYRAPHMDHNPMEIHIDYHDGKGQQVVVFDGALDEEKKQEVSGVGGGGDSSRSIACDGALQDASLQLVVVVVVVVPYPLILIVLGEEEGAAG